MRIWLCCSPNKDKAFCFNCKLFSDFENVYTKHGYSAWKSAIEGLESHETNQAHCNTTINFSRKSRWMECVNSLITQHFQSKYTYMAAGIKFLAECRLAFKGHSKTLRLLNSGSFLILWNCQCSLIHFWQCIQKSLATKVEVLCYVCHPQFVKVLRLKCTYQSQAVHWQSLKNHREAYRSVSNHFRLLSCLSDIDVDVVKEAADILIIVYLRDLDQSFAEEHVH